MSGAQAGNASAGTELLSVSGLNVSLGGRRKTRILHDVDFSVAAGEIVGLIGETGSGKTTFARAVLGLVPADSGTIRYEGQEVSRLRRKARRDFRRRGHLQYIFQDPLRSLDPDRTIFDSIVEGLVVQGGRSRGELQRAAQDAVELVSLPVGLLSKYPGEVSGGQRQRVAIARAMALNPRLMICDEPVSALDASNRIKILDLLRELRERSQVGVVLITHDLGSLGGVADRVGVLYRGRIVETGTTEEIFVNPQHPYTRLLVASVPALFGEPIDAESRRRIREEVRELTA